MAIEKLIDSGDKLCEEQLYEEAIEQYDLALKENPKAFKALIAKSIALQRSKKTDEALGIVFQALEVAEQRGSRELIGVSYFRLFTIYYNKTDYQTAVKYLNSANDSNYDPKSSELWMSQLRRKIGKLGLKDFDFEARVKTPKNENSQVEEPVLEEKQIGSPNVDKDQAAQHEEASKSHQNEEPLPNPFEKKSPNFKIDWFQSLGKVTVTIFVKNIPKDESLKIKYRKDSVSVEFPTTSGSEFQYDIGPLFGDINPSESTHQVFSTKLELSLAKVIETKWRDLTRSADEGPAKSNPQDTSAEIPGAALSYPNSAKNARDWSKLALDDDDEEQEKQDENSFFSQLYKDADDDTKRAMMKSYIESNGTTLSTNWDEVSKKKVETAPPDGLEAKKW